MIESDIQNPLNLPDWKSYLRDSFPLEEENMQIQKIKENRLRSVFLLTMRDQSRFFLKYDHPQNYFERAKNYFKTKSEKEYYSALLLEKSQIPVAYYVGWGKRKNGDSFLLSKSVENANSARNIWVQLSKNFGNITVEHPFIAGLCDLYAQFMDNQLYHPDFHFGNILVLRTTKKMVLIDPYGVKHLPKIPLLFQNKMLLFFTSLRMVINDFDAIDVLLQAKAAKNRKQAEQLWHKICVIAVQRADQSWEKRKKDVLKGHPSLTFIQQTEKGELHALRQFDDNVLDFDDKENYHWTEFVDATYAKVFWLFAFRLRFLGIPVKYPMAVQYQESHARFLFSNQWSQSSLTPSFLLKKRLEQSPYKQITFPLCCRESEADTVIDLEKLLQNPHKVDLYHLV